MGELGLPISLKLVRSGFYPHGGGEILVRIRGGSVEALRRGKRGDLKEIRIRSWQTNLREEVAQRQASGAKKILAAHRLEAEVEMGSLPSRSRSTALAVAAMFESSRCCFTGLGEPGKRAEIIGEETARRLLDFLDSEAVLEEHMADQILLPLCMAREDSEFTVSTITEHFLTNAGVIRIFRNVQFQLPEEGRSEGLVVVRPP
jgi:RNA 3'-terminal phosphate cyclase (ATP)